MQAIKEKTSNMVSSAKESIENQKAKAQEKVWFHCAAIIVYLCTI